MKKIVIVDYGLGNLASVANALASLKIPFIISDTFKDIARADGIILPGVGAAGKGMELIRQKNLEFVLREKVAHGTPLFGICLGMQLLFTSSEEGDIACLGFIEGTVKKFTTSLKVPQIGWNTVTSNPHSRLFKGIAQNSYYYFVHSYYCEPKEKTMIMGRTTYDISFCSFVEKENIFGAQFHPEKSGKAGLKILQNFWEVVCK